MGITAFKFVIWGGIQIGGFTVANYVLRLHRCIPIKLPIYVPPQMTNLNAVIGISPK